MNMTLKELAKKLNVSISTISRVVNNKSYVKPETKKKILKALKEYNYTPNQVARSLKNKVTNTIGIVVPDISEDFFAYVIKGIDSVLGQSGYMMILCDTGENPEKEEMYLKMLMEKQIDGLVLATVSKEDEVLSGLLGSEMGIVFFDNLPNIRKSYDAVITDNARAGYMAVEHLVKLGHRNIGIIAGKQDETTGVERLAGYRNALNDYKLPVENRLIRIGDFKEKSGFENMLSLLEANKDMTAVHITSSKMTYGAIKAIREKGLRIPEDIALVGFDIHDPTGLIHPGITTVLQNEENLGKMAGELLLKRLGQKDNGISKKILLEPQLMIRESCGSILGRRSL